MRVGSVLEYWRQRAYGNEATSKIAQVIYHEVDDLRDNLRILEAGAADTCAEAEAKTAVGDILAMLQEICTLKRWDLPTLHMAGCQRAAERCKEHLDKEVK